MAVHFIAILGVSLYEPVYYEDMGFITNEERQFVQTAIIEKYINEFEKDAKISIFVTQKAHDLNYVDREYTQNDKNRAENWKDEKKDRIVVGKKKEGLESEIKKLFSGKNISVNHYIIPDGKNSNEIWDIYNTIYSVLDEGDNVIFDITHGYRSIPMMALSVVNYAKALKNCNLFAIQYGAFEASRINDDGRKVTPIFNMTPFNEIMEWSNAADVFSKYGNASQIRRLYNSKLSSVNDKQKADWESIGEPIDYAESLSKTLQTGRGIGPAFVRNEKEKKSIKGAYNQFQHLQLNNYKGKNEIQPICNILIKAKNRFKDFEKAENYRVGFAVIKWYIDSGMIQQGYTALEETVVTYLCSRYKLNEVVYHNRDYIVKNALTFFAGYEKRKGDDKKLKKHEFFEKYFDKSDMVDTDLKKLKKIYNELPAKLGNIFDNIRKCRNDINHFGIRQSPKSYAVLENNLIEYYQETIRIIDKWDNKKNN